MLPNGADNQITNLSPPAESIDVFFQRYPLLEQYRGNTQLISPLRQIETLFSPKCLDQFISNNQFLLNNEGNNLKNFSKLLSTLIAEYQLHMSGALNTLISLVLQEKTLYEGFFRSNNYNALLSLLQYIAPLPLSSESLASIFSGTTTASQLKILTAFKLSLTADIVHNLLKITDSSTIEKIRQRQIAKGSNTTDIEAIISNPESLNATNGKKSNEKANTPIPTILSSVIGYYLTKEEQNTLRDNYDFAFLGKLHQSWTKEQIETNLKKLCNTNDPKFKYIYTFANARHDVEMVNRILTLSDSENIALIAAAAHLKNIFNNLAPDIGSQINKFYGEAIILALYNSYHWENESQKQIEQWLGTLYNIAMVSNEEREPVIRKMAFRLLAIDAEFKSLHDMLTCVDPVLVLPLLDFLAHHLYLPGRDQTVDDKFLRLILQKKAQQDFFIRYSLNPTPNSASLIEAIFADFDKFAGYVNTMELPEEEREMALKEQAEISDRQMIERAEKLGLVSPEVIARWKEESNSEQIQHCTAAQRGFFMSQRLAEIAASHQKYIQDYSTFYADAHSNNVERAKSDWYDNEKLRQLFNAERHPEVLFVCGSGILPFWNDDGYGVHLTAREVLGDQLNVQLKERMEEHEDGLNNNPNKFYIPFQIHSNHWIGVFVDNSKETPAVYWMDSLGNEPPQGYKEGLIELLNSINICGDKELTLDNLHCQNKKLQMDGYNCGVWLFEMRNRYLENGKFPIEPKKEDYAIIRDLREYLDQMYVAIQLSVGTLNLNGVASK